MKTHKVKQGESLSSIAYDYGFKVWETLYNASENADLKRKRPNPNLLYPGDEVVIPELKSKNETDLATDKLHKFVIKGERFLFRMEMNDSVMNPLVGFPFKFYIGNELIKEVVTQEKGLIEFSLSKKVRTGKIEFLGETYDVVIGGLDPVSRVSGIQQRLTNLGYNAGPVNGIFGALTSRSLHEFQLNHEKEGLIASGEIDDDTRKLIQQIHDADDKTIPFEG